MRSEDQNDQVVKSTPRGRRRVYVADTCRYQGTKGWCECSKVDWGAVSFNWDIRLKCLCSVEVFLEDLRSAWPRLRTINKGNSTAEEPYLGSTYL